MEANTQIVEAVLLLEVEPISESSLARIAGLSVEEVEKALTILEKRYSSDEFGITPAKTTGGWALSPKVHLQDRLKTRYGKQRSDRLSRAALETLSIVAYSQPLTRSEIENLRGVNADSMIRILKDKKLIKEVGCKDTPGRPSLYGTTKEFLKAFRLESIADLPKLDEQELERFAQNEDA